ncbi:MAG TPA: hypothetical protein VH500_16210 [Nitrososphaeraceae archaeon]
MKGNLRKILITGTHQVVDRLESKLRYTFDVTTEIIPDNPNDVCQISAKIRRDWITICSFSSKEDLKNIITMFEVNYAIRSR